MEGEGDTGPSVIAFVVCSTVSVRRDRRIDRHCLPGATPRPRRTRLREHERSGHRC
jgi:hypothetical protein